MSTAQELTQLVQQTIKKIEKEKTILDAEFINVTPWWGKGPTGKMIEKYDTDDKDKTKTIHSLPTAKTIIGKTRWVMATYLSPHVGQDRLEAEKIISGILGSQKRASKVRIIVKPEIITNNSPNKGSEKKSGEGSGLQDEVLRKYDLVMKRISGNNLPFAPNRVKINVKIIERKRLSPTEKFFLVKSLLVALAIYGIGGRANRGYGRFVPVLRKDGEYEGELYDEVIKFRKALTITEHCNSVCIAKAILETLQELDNLSYQIAREYGIVRSAHAGEGLWPLPPLMTIKEISEYGGGGGNPPSVPILVDATEAIDDRVAYLQLIGSISIMSHTIEAISRRKSPPGGRRFKHTFSEAIRSGFASAIKEILKNRLPEEELNKLSESLADVLASNADEILSGLDTETIRYVNDAFGGNDHLTLLAKALTGLPKNSINRKIRARRPRILRRRQSALVVFPSYFIKESPNGTDQDSIGYNGIVMLLHYPSDLFADNVFDYLKRLSERDPSEATKRMISLFLKGFMIGYSIGSKIATILSLINNGIPDISRVAAILGKLALDDRTTLIHVVGKIYGRISVHVDKLIIRRDNKS